VSDPKDTERRVSHRVKMIAWPASYSFDDNPTVLTEAEIQDFSPAGAFLSASPEECERVIPGRILTLHGEMWGAPFTLPAEVRWVGWSEIHDRYGFGVEIDREVSLWRLLHSPSAPMGKSGGSEDKG